MIGFANASEARCRSHWTDATGRQSVGIVQHAIAIPSETQAPFQLRKCWLNLHWGEVYLSPDTTNRSHEAWGSTSMLLYFPSEGIRPSENTGIFLVGLWSSPGSLKSKISACTQHLISWCFEPSQHLGIISEMKTNLNPSLTFSAHKSFNIGHNIFFSRHSYSAGPLSSIQLWGGSKGVTNFPGIFRQCGV